MAIKLYAITMAKDEADIIGYTIEHLVANGVDGIIVANNVSSDNTQGVLEEVQARFPNVDIDVRWDGTVAYTQAVKMNALARSAAEKGATWILPFDADELWYMEDGSSLKDGFTTIDDNGGITVKALYVNHRPTSRDIDDINPYKRIIWRWHEPTNYKTAYKYDDNTWLSNGNHFVRYNHRPYLEDPDPVLDIVSIRHYQYRSLDHFITKTLNARAACMALPDNDDLRGGAAWSEQIGVYNEKGEQGLIDFYYEKIYTEGDMGTMICDPAPFRSYNV